MKRGLAKLKAVPIGKHWEYVEVRPEDTVEDIKSRAFEKFNDRDIRWMIDLEIIDLEVVEKKP